MTETLEAPKLEDGSGVGNLVYVIKTPEGKYACYHHEGVFGMAVFSTERTAGVFIEFMPHSDLEILKVSLSEAKGIAFERSMVSDKRLRCLLLLDNIREPKVIPL